MPMPGPLGRLVRRGRLDRRLTQPQLSDLTERYGVRVPQNTISRLESGKTQRMNNTAYLDALGKALGFASNRDFIVAAYGAKGMADDMENPELPDMELLVRTLAISFDLTDAETAQLRRAVDHVRDTATAVGPSPEERIAAYARRIVARRGVDDEDLSESVRSPSGFTES